MVIFLINLTKGLMMMKDTRGIVKDNLIKGNEGIGLYIRDKSHGDITLNEVIF